MSSDQLYAEGLRRDVERDLAAWLADQERRARERELGDAADAIAFVRVAVEVGTYRGSGGGGSK